jgi:hypothetical protein
MLENAGLQFVGCDESGKRMEVLNKHPVHSFIADFLFQSLILLFHL